MKMIMLRVSILSILNNSALLVVFNYSISSISQFMEPEEAKTISKYKDMYRSIMDGEPIEPNLVDLSAETLLAHRIEIRNLGEKQANIKDKKQLPVQKLHDS